MPPRTPPTDAALLELRSFGLRYPGAHTKSPWPGHLDLAVNDKTFAYLSIEGEPFTLSCKLPRSSDDALTLPFVTPTPYGLGKSGWVTASLPGGPVPIELFKAWLEESYRAQAPKRLSKQLDETPAAAEAPGAATGKRGLPHPEPPEQPSRKQPSAKQPSAKRSPAKRSPAKQVAASRPRAAKKPAQRKALVAKARAAR
jgi:predicted DNA-binding protein (MmcQ/YjbR family)